MQETFLCVKRNVVICAHAAARRSELAYRSRQSRQLIVPKAQPLERGELPDLRRQARQLIVADVQPLERGDLPDGSGEYGLLV